MPDIKRKIFILLFILVFIITAGTVGYIIIEKWTIVDSLFMTVITMSTVGYGETQPLSQTGKIFTMFLNLGGIALYSFSFFSIMSLVSSGSIQKMLRRAKMNKKINTFTDHYIICGAGETGKHIVKELTATKKDFVVIDKNEENINKTIREDIIYVVGDAHDEIILNEAGIADAAGIFCALPDDKENIFLVLAARELNKNIRIVSRCTNENSYTKFYRAGANGVIYSNRIGGLRMASEMLRPDVVNFLDKMLRESGSVRFEEVYISDKSSAAGKTLNELNISRKFNVIVTAFLTEQGEYEYNYPSNSQRKISKNEYIIVIGCADEISKFGEFINA